MLMLPPYTHIKQVQELAHHSHQARWYAQSIEDSAKNASFADRSGTEPVPVREVRLQHGLWHRSLHALFGHRARQSAPDPVK